MHKNIEHSKTAMGVSFAGQCAMYSIWSPLEASNITSKHKSRAASNAAALHILSPSLCDCITLTGGIKCKKTANEGRRLLCGQKKKTAKSQRGYDDYVGSSWCGISKYRILRMDINLFVGGLRTVTITQFQ